VINVIFEGALSKYGPYQMEVATPNEAMRGLLLQVPGLMEDLCEGYYRFCRHHGDLVDVLTEDRLGMNFGQADTFTITPVAQGAGVVESIILGIQFVAGITFEVAVGTAAFTVPVGKILIAASLVGIVQLLSPVPDGGSFEQREKADDRPSFLFNGPVNVSTQGTPVPLVYGRMRTGSVVASTGLAVEDIGL